jgi:hypothetical protein
VETKAPSGEKLDKINIEHCSAERIHFPPFIGFAPSELFSPFLFHLGGYVHLQRSCFYFLLMCSFFTVTTLSEWGGIYENERTRKGNKQNSTRLS